MRSWLTMMMIAAMGLDIDVANGADIDRRELQLPELSQPRAIYQLSTGELVLQADSARTGTTTSEFYRVHSSGRASIAFTAPPTWPAHLFFRNRVLSVEYEGSGHAHVQRVVLSGGGRERRQILYETRAASDVVRAAGALEGDLIYVAEPFAGPTFRIVALDTSGRQKWKFESRDSAVRELVPIPGGLALALWDHGHVRGSPPSILLALSRDGTVRWKLGLARPKHVGHEIFTFQPPDLIVSLRIPDSLRHGWDLLRFDVRDGSVLGQHSIPPASRMRATPHGLLVFDNLVHQPFVSLIKRDGTIAWSRRIPVHPEHGGRLIDATITRSGQLTLLGSYTDDPLEAEYRVEKAMLITTSAAKPSATPGCLDVDVAEIIRLERLMEVDHAIAPSAVLAGDNWPCKGLAHADYLRFLQELSRSLGREPTDPNNWNFRVYAGVQPVEAITLSSYGARQVISDAPTDALVFEVPPDAAADFAAHIRTTVRPHLERMNRLQQRFQTLMGAPLTIEVQDPQACADPALFSKLESAMRMIVDATAAIPADERLTRESGQLYRIHPKLTSEGFGAQADLSPLSDIRSTVRALFARKPRNE